MKPVLSILFLLPTLLAFGDSAIRSISELNRAALQEKDVGRTFELTGRILAAEIRCRPLHFILSNDSGAIRLSHRPGLPKCDFAAGNEVRVSGRIFTSAHGIYSPQVEHVTVLGNSPPPKAVQTDISSLLKGRHIGQLVRFCGTVLDIQRDDIDPNWAIFTLFDGGETLFASYSIDKAPLPDPRLFLCAKVEVKGFCTSYPLRHRHFLGANVDISDPDGIRMLTSPPQDPFAAPPLDEIQNATSRSLLALGYRTTTGRVLAVCGTGMVIVRTTHDNIAHISFLSAEPPPVGSVVDISGLPSTDLYRLNLHHAIWRASSSTMADDDSRPKDTTAAAILTSKDGRNRIHLEFHGQTVRITGEVLTLPAVGNDEGIMRIRNGKFIVPVDVSACPDALADVTVGCTVRIAGVCVLQQNEQTFVGRLPNFRDFTVVMRSPRDLEILARPPWWTPGRLLAVIGALLSLLFGIGIWNFALRSLAERRGKELAAENIARAESDLRVYERTRLAVELHDSIAQNLSGVSLELDAARDFGGENPVEMTRHLDIAARTLRSCRGELRNCMWDLRNQTLEDERMDDAIRRTLAPHLGGASLAVRFDVPRERLSDNTALAILRIIRELTVNAVRHGHAKSIHVAGCVEDGRLMFSVRDDGCGFDPGSRPGIEEGHFGLQGISERIEGFNGGISISSAPGHGAKITVRIPIPGACAPQGEKR